MKADAVHEGALIQTLPRAARVLDDSTPEGTTAVLFTREQLDALQIAVRDEQKNDAYTQDGAPAHLIVPRAPALPWGWRVTIPACSPVCWRRVAAVASVHDSAYKLRSFGDNLRCDVRHDPNV